MSTQLNSQIKSLSAVACGVVLMSLVGCAQDSGRSLPPPPAVAAPVKSPADVKSATPTPPALDRPATPASTDASKTPAPDAKPVASGAKKPADATKTCVATGLTKDLGLTATTAKGILGYWEVTSKTPTNALNYVVIAKDLRLVGLTSDTKPGCVRELDYGNVVIAHDGSAKLVSNAKVLAQGAAAGQTADQVEKLVKAALLKQTGAQTMDFMFNKQTSHLKKAATNDAVLKIEAAVATPTK